MKGSIYILVLISLPCFAFSSDPESTTTKSVDNEETFPLFDGKIDKSTLKNFKREVTEKRELIGTFLSEIGAKLLENRVEKGGVRQARENKKKSSKVSLLTVAIITKAIVVGVFLTGLKLLAGKLFLDFGIVAVLGIIYALWNHSGSSSKGHALYNLEAYRPTVAGWTSNSLGNSWPDQSQVARTLNIDNKNMVGNLHAQDIAYANQKPSM